MGQRIQAARKKAGFTQTTFAEALGVKQPSVSAWERDDSEPSTELMIEIGALTGRAPGWLQFGKAESEGARIVGAIGAGAVVIPFSDLETTGELVPKPAGFERYDVEAYEIQGDSMYPLKEGWLVFVQKNRTVDAKMITRRLCVVGLPSGEALLKEVHPGQRKGRFNLHSWNAPPRSDVALDWANPVIDIRPRSGR